MMLDLYYTYCTKYIYFLDLFIECYFDILTVYNLFVTLNIISLIFFLGNLTHYQSFGDNIAQTKSILEFIPVPCMGCSLLTVYTCRSTRL